MMAGNPQNKYSGIGDYPDSTSIPNAPTRQPKATDALGAPGQIIYSGFLVDNEKDAKLAGQRKFQTYSDIIANVSIVAAGVRFFLSLVAKAEWEVEPADDSAEAKRLAELVEDIIKDTITPWHRIVRRAAMFRMYGFGIQEWTAKKRDDGVIGFLDISPRAQSTIYRWDVDMHGQVNGVVQLAPQNSAQIYLPRQKLVYLVDDAMNDSPEGLGLFRHLAKAADKLARFELLEAWAYETDIRGIPIGRAPLKDLQQLKEAGRVQDADAQVEVLKGFIRNHIKSPGLGMVLDAEPFRNPDQTLSSMRKWEIELLKGEAGPHAQIAAAIERLNREMARVLGVEHLLLGSDSKGSHAMATDKSQSFGEMVDSTLVEVRAGFGKDLLEPLWRLNGWDRDLMPTFHTAPIAYRDIQSVTAAMFQLAQAGAPLAPNDPAINQIRKLIGLLDAPEQDLSLMPQSIPGMPAPPGPKKPSRPQGPATGTPGEPGQPMDNSPEEQGAVEKARAPGGSSAGGRYERAIAGSSNLGLEHRLVPMMQGEGGEQGKCHNPIPYNEHVDALASGGLTELKNEVAMRGVDMDMPIGRLATRQSHVTRERVGHMMRSGQIDARGGRALAVMMEDGTLGLIDGNHRAAAAKLMGQGTIPGRVLPVEALQHSGE